MTTDFARTVNVVKQYRQDFVLSPHQWRTFNTSLTLDWNKVKFTKKNLSQIPFERGIYAFVIECPERSFPPHGYIMYVGITGAQASRQTLRDRYGNYLTESRELKRAKIHYLLGNWARDLYFHYATVKDRRYSLNNLEHALCDALLPPFNINDFSARIRKVVKAFS